MDLLNALPNIWPFISLFKISLLPKEIKEPVSGLENAHKKLEENTTNGLQGKATELAARHLRLSTYLLMAMFTYYLTPYPDITLDLEDESNRFYILYWAPFILSRNVIMVGSLYSGWHYFLYENKTMRGKLRNRKFDGRNLDENGALNLNWGMSSLSLSCMKQNDRMNCHSFE